MGETKKQSGFVHLTPWANSRESVASRQPIFIRADAVVSVERLPATTADKHSAAFAERTKVVTEWPRSGKHDAGDTFLVEEGTEEVYSLIRVALAGDAPPDEPHITGRTSGTG